MTGGPADGPNPISGKDPPSAEADRFPALLSAYPERGRAWANQAEARRLFAALSPADQAQAIAAAGAYAAHCRANPTGTPKYLHSWLRNGVFRNHAPVAPSPAATAPRSVFVPAGSPGWEAWSRHLRQLGRPVPAPVRSDTAKAEGWWFPAAMPSEVRS
ncbi:hypothetical protein NS228_20465 [Methylobacterium indicum]|uniref:hypothetical protein n=1 Tax=Methylobacterium indicum TaxID=1775910 RepID=UPI000734FC64|nr:hypothetical protein [Methylobacterium indicum]KTS35651.1 hypothetical protein NS228_20465 [Methylobacterium indicum]